MFSFICRYVTLNLQVENSAGMNVSSPIWEGACYYFEYPTEEIVIPSFTCYRPVYRLSITTDLRIWMMQVTSLTQNL